MVMVAKWLNEFILFLVEREFYFKKINPKNSNNRVWIPVDHGCNIAMDWLYMREEIGAGAAGTGTQHDKYILDAIFRLVSNSFHHQLQSLDLIEHFFYVFPINVINCSSRCFRVSKWTFYLCMLNFNLCVDW